MKYLNAFVLFILFSVLIYKLNLNNNIDNNIVLATSNYRTLTDNYEYKDTYTNNSNKKVYLSSGNTQINCNNSENNVNISVWFLNEKDNHLYETLSLSTGQSTKIYVLVESTNNNPITCNYQTNIQVI